MENEDRNDGRDAADQIAAEYAGKTRALMRRASIAGMENSSITPTEADFCPNCEFVRLMNPDGLGYCKEHGDIDGRENDPRDHTGENL